MASTTTPAKSETLPKAAELRYLLALHGYKAAVFLESFLSFSFALFVVKNHVMESNKQTAKQSSIPGFHVFSIRQRPSSADEQRDPNTRQYITRKSHRKSRLGCVGCKTKRVKCDEGRPKCGRCERTKIACDYTSTLQTPRNKQQTEERHCRTPSATTLIPNPAAPIADLLQRSPRNLNLLTHYDGFTGSDRDTVTCSDILDSSQSASYRAEVLRLAQEHSFLLHAILAVAALHLSHFDVQGYGLAKLQHLQVALTDFQHAINKSISKRGADAILLTSMMISMQYFSWIDSTDPRNSWVFSEEPSRLDWMQAQLGNLPLLAKLAPHLGDSLLKPIWSHSTYLPDAFCGIPEGMLVLCDVREEMSVEERAANPYFEMLQMLGPLLLFERGSSSFVRYVRFMNRLTRPFFELVKINDPTALLVLSYWYGLMCSVEFWWTKRRSYRDCIALCMYLEEHGSKAIRSLLDFPARACGYDLDRARADIVGRITAVV